MCHSFLVQGGPTSPSLPGVSTLTVSACHISGPTNPCVCGQCLWHHVPSSILLSWSVGSLIWLISVGSLPPRMYDGLRFLLTTSVISLRTIRGVHVSRVPFFFPHSFSFSPCSRRAMRCSEVSSSVILSCLSPLYPPISYAMPFHGKDLAIPHHGKDNVISFQRKNNAITLYRKNFYRVYFLDLTFVLLLCLHGPPINAMTFLILTPWGL